MLTTVTPQWRFLILALFATIVVIVMIFVSHGLTQAQQSQRMAQISQQVPQFIFASSSPPTGGTTSDALTAQESPAADRISLTSGTAAEPKGLTAHAALVADLEKGSEFFALHAERQWPLASITKLMTAAIVTRDTDPDKVIVVHKIPASLASQDSGSVLLQEGERYHVRDLLKLLLLVSSNEAAEALANDYGFDNFIDEMNRQAAVWGMASTHYDEPTGLSVSNQSNTRDMRILAEKIYTTFPAIFKTTQRQRATITELNSSATRDIDSINAFAGRSDFLGGKTGFTTEAQGNLLSLFDADGRPVIVIVLGTKNRFGESEKLINWFHNDYRASN